MTSGHTSRQATACLSAIKERIARDCISCSEVSRFCTSITEALRVVPILRGLDPELAKGCVCKLFSANEIVFSQSDESSDVFFIVCGRIRVIAFSASGKEVIYRELEPGRILGELSAIDGEFRSETAIAIENSRLIRMPASDFKKLLKVDQDITESVLRELANKVRSLSQRVFELSTMSVKNRLYAELLRLAEAYGNFSKCRVIISPSPTHSEIASRIGTHREAVTRELNELRRIGAISLGKRSITINDFESFAMSAYDNLSHPTWPAG